MQANEDDNFEVKRKVVGNFWIVVAGVIGAYAPPESAIETKQECLVPLGKLTWQALKGIVADLCCSLITATLIYL